MDSMQLLIADLDHLRRSLLQSEEMGEKRFEFFMALVTAAVAGLIALATADKHPLPWLPVVAIGSLAGIVAFGTLTYLRMLHRNQVTDRLKRTIDEVWGYAKAHYELGYDLKWPSHRKLLTGGYVETVATINGMLVIALVAMLVNEIMGYEPTTALLIAVPIGVAFTVVLWIPAILRNLGRT
jgi:hypothetical protein